MLSRTAATDGAVALPEGPNATGPGMGVASLADAGGGLADGEGVGVGAGVSSTAAVLMCAATRATGAFQMDGSVGKGRARRGTGARPISCSNTDPRRGPEPFESVRGAAAVRWLDCCMRASSSTSTLSRAMAATIDPMMMPASAPFDRHVERSSKLLPSHAVHTPSPALQAVQPESVPAQQ